MKLIASYSSWHEEGGNRQVEWVINSISEDSPFPDGLPCDGPEWSLFRNYVSTWVNRLLVELGYQKPVSAICTSEWWEFEGPLMVLWFPTEHYPTSRIRRRIANQLCQIIEAKYASISA